MRPQWGNSTEGARMTQRIVWLTVAALLVLGGTAVADHNWTTNRIVRMKLNYQSCAAMAPGGSFGDFTWVHSHCWWGPPAQQWRNRLAWYGLGTAAILLIGGA